MVKHFYRLPKFLQKFMGGKLSPDGTDIFLTFDDGPHPDSTPELLKILAEHQAEASFFCTGENVEKYNTTFQMILAEGHTIGIHGYKHLNGFRTGTNEYLQDLRKAANLIPSNIFRPPFGRLTPGQYQKLKNDFGIYYWDILFRDYDPRFNPDLAFQKAKKYISPGKMIVMHDNPANIKNTKVLLTLILESLHKCGFKPKKIIHSDV